MTTLRSWLAGCGLAALTAAGLAVACQHGSPTPAIQPVPREAPPLAPRPDPGPNLDLRPRAGTSTPRVDAGITSVGRRGPRVAAAPVDAGVDGPLTMPKVKDAGVIRDAGQPMQ